MKEKEEIERILKTAIIKTQSIKKKSQDIITMLPMAPAGASMTSGMIEDESTELVDLLNAIKTLLTKIK